MKKFLTLLLGALIVPALHGQLAIGNGGQVSISSTGSLGTIGSGYAYGASGSFTYSTTIPWSSISGAPTSFAPNGTASGDLCGSFPSPTICKLNGSQSLSGVQGSTGSKVFVCTGVFTAGHFVTVDANGNCVDGGASPGTATITAGSGVSVVSGVVTNLGNTDTNLVTSSTYHLDPTGTTDITSSLSAWFNSGNDIVGYLPCGTYKQLSPITINATSTTGKNIKIYAASSDCVTINMFSGDGWWFNNTTTNADNNFGPTIEGIVFNDSSGTCAVHSAVRITQYANIGKQDWKVTNFCGVQYQTGTVAVTNGSQTATLTGGTCPSGSAAGDVLWVAGKYQEITTCSGTAVTFTIPWQYATASGASYSLDRNGEGFILDGGTSYVQYNKGWLNIRAVGVRVGVHALGTNVASRGVSRFDFGPSFINCNRVNDSMTYLLGDTSDTFTITTKANNCSRFVHAENTHNLVVDLAKFENDGAGTTAFGCTASPNAWSCNVFVEAIASNTSPNARGNKVTNSYAYGVGTGISWDGNNKNFVAAFNDLETFAVDSPIVPPSTGTLGYTTAEVHDPTMTLLPGGIVVIPPVSVTVPGFDVPANTCYGSAGSTTPADFTFTGLLPTMGITAKYTGNVSAITGWGATGGLSINAYPSSTSGHGKYVVCNPTGSLITGGTITFQMEGR